MTPGPLVSIVTPSYNQGRHIRATIESVLAQTYHPVEYLVIDGGSTDETVSILREFGNRITWVSEPDRGQAHAINKGFRRARGEIVSWVNSDDLLVPHAAALAVEAFAGRPEAGFVYGDAYLIDEHGHVDGMVQSPEPNPWMLANVSDYIVQPSAFFRRSALAEVGWIDESWHWALDWDVLMRLSLAFESIHIPAIMACSRIYDATKTGSGGLARFAEIDRFVRTYSDRRLAPAFWRYAMETALLGTGRMFRRATGALGLDPLVPSMILQAALAPTERRLSSGADRPPLHRRLERRSRTTALARLGWLAAHPMRTLYPDTRALRRRDQVRRRRTSTFWGEKLTVILPDAVSEQVLRWGYFAPEASSFFIRYLRPGMAVLDVGAHLGYFSLLARQCVGAAGQVHAFEPTPATAEQLRANVAAHHQVRVVEEAVASLTLDSYCGERGLSPDLVKIHAENAEHEVLAGMSTLLDQARPALVLAVGDLGGPDVVPSRELVDHILGCGYTVFEPLMGSLRAHQPRAHYSFTNLVFLP